eukprot:GHVQ01034716.1.p1 GENE.GHVQ01034716.1~~GHVQ01034716.1.p1  ORF type:complete len:311 (-),score=70.72 GHVQ01034716.1:879-1811(-)
MDFLTFLVVSVIFFLRCVPLHTTILNSHDSTQPPLLAPPQASLLLLLRKESLTDTPPNRHLRVQMAPPLTSTLRAAHKHILHSTPTLDAQLQTEQEGQEAVAVPASAHHHSSHTQVDRNKPTYNAEYKQQREGIVVLRGGRMDEDGTGTDSGVSLSTGGGGGGRRVRSLQEAVAAPWWEGYSVGKDFGEVGVGHEEEEGGSMGMVYRGDSRQDLMREFNNQLNLLLDQSWGPKYKPVPYAHIVGPMPALGVQTLQTAKWFKRYMIAQSLLMYRWWIENYANTDEKVGLQGGRINHERQDRTYPWTSYLSQ